MLEPFMQLLILAAANASISITLTQSKMFDNVRALADVINPGFLGETFQCRYCMSHWIGLLLVAIYQPVMIHAWGVADYAVSLFVLVCITSIIGSIMLALQNIAKRTLTTNNK